MALATRCPHCQTTFKVAQDQLKLRSGLVRCGTCKQVFNGIEHLVSPDIPAPVFATTPVATPAKIPDTALPPSPPPSVTPSPAILDITVVASAKPEPAKPSVDFVSLDEPPLNFPSLTGAPQMPPSVPAGKPAEASPPKASVASTIPAAPVLPTIPAPAPVTAEPAPPPEPTAVPPSPPMKAEVPPEPPSEPPKTPEPEPAPQTVAFAGPETDEPAPSPPPPAAEEAPKTGTESKPEQEPGTPTNTEELSLAEAETGMEAEPEEPHQDEEIDEPDFVVRSRKRQRRARIARIFMACASVVLLLALTLQGAFAFRNQLAAWFPQTKPWLAQLCAVAGCQVRLPAQIEMVTIESNELQALAADKHTFTLSLLLRNHSTVTQAWPHIELTLNDANESALARRVLLPRDYLPPAQDGSKGFAANSEQPVKLNFELPQLKASGYRVYLFYP